MPIRSLELEPNKENLLKTISKDLLDRNKCVYQFAHFCDMQDGKCSIAVEANWGSGKTFFIRHVQMLIESFNPFIKTFSDDEKKLIRNAFSNFIPTDRKDSEFEPSICVYYDAWSNDNDGDPILSLVYEIIKNTSQTCPLKKSIDCIKAASLIADFFTGKNLSNLVDLLHEKDVLSELKSKKEIHDLVNEFLDSLLYENGNRLIIFIDELDRCCPEYSVRFLERIKHYFSNDRITYVFAINTNELQHTIKRYYGDEFNAYKYLDRFFDYKISLPPANMLKYYSEIGLENGAWVYESVCKAVIDYHHFSLREIEKYYRWAKIAAFKPTHDNHSFGFSEGYSMQFSLMIFVPIIIGLKIADAKLYSDFIEGKNPDPLLDIFNNSEFGMGICRLLFSEADTYSDNESYQTALAERLKEAYDTVFGNAKKSDFNYVQIGKCAFNNEIKDVILRTTSFLSKYSSFD